MCLLSSRGLHAQEILKHVSDSRRRHLQGKRPTSSLQTSLVGRPSIQVGSLTQAGVVTRKNIQTCLRLSARGAGSSPEGYSRVPAETHAALHLVLPQNASHYNFKSFDPEVLYTMQQVFKGLSFTGVATVSLFRTLRAFPAVLILLADIERGIPPPKNKYLSLHN